MYSERPVLIVEDNAFLAVDLAEAIEELKGRVVGPTGRITEALGLLDSHEVGAAIVDVHITDLDVVVLTSRLTQLGVPFVLQAESELPVAIGFLHPEVPVLRKPIHPRAVMTCLLEEIRKAAPVTGRIVAAKLDASPKLV